MGNRNSSLALSFASNSLHSLSDRSGEAFKQKSSESALFNVVMEKKVQIFRLETERGFTELLSQTSID